MRAPTETKPLCASERRASTPDAIGLPPGSPAGGGAALETLISSRGPAPVGVALRIVLDACAELQVIHTARPRGSDGSGPGHWSPSPDAIFVGSDGTAKVAGADPGEGASGPHAAQHARPGRLGYAAPEALLTGSSSPRSDVFTLGVVLWELLAGRRLFERRRYDRDDEAQRGRRGAEPTPADLDRARRRHSQGPRATSRGAHQDDGGARVAARGVRPRPRRAPLGGRCVGRPRALEHAVAAFGRGGRPPRCSAPPDAVRARRSGAADRETGGAARTAPREAHDLRALRDQRAHRRRHRRRGVHRSHVERVDAAAHGGRPGARRGRRAGRARGAAPVSAPRPR